MQHSSISFVWSVFFLFFCFFFCFATIPYQPIPKDLFYCELKEPFNPRKGWLLWTIIALACYYVWCLSSFYKLPDVKEECKEWWYVLLQCTNFSTLCMFVCIIGPVAEEVLHRGFFLASLTKWVPTQVAVGISSYLLLSIEIQFLVPYLVIMLWYFICNVEL